MLFYGYLFEHFKLRLTNPIYSISLKDFVIEKLRECETINGSEHFKKLIESVDKDIMQKLNEVLS